MAEDIRGIGFKIADNIANKIGIECLTVYAFSTENWKRPDEEVSALMNIFRDYLKDSKNFKEDNIRLRFIGDRSVLDDDIIQLMCEAENDSADACSCTYLLFKRGIA